MTESMFCPRCGTQFEAATSFCRTCGLSLDGVSQIVSGEAESKPVVTRRPNFKLFQIGVGLVILGLVIGLINGALRDFELFPQSYGKLIFLLFVAAGMLTLGAGFLFPTKVYKKQKRTNADADVSNTLNTGPLGSQLPPATIIVEDIKFPKDSREKITSEPASVTENTTRNLN